MLDINERTATASKTMMTDETTTTTAFSEIENELEDWMRNKSLAEKVIAGRRTAEHVVHINSQATDSSLDAFASTFVDLYIASHAQCIAMGVGRFAYLAAKLSGTACQVRYETSTLPVVSSRWGMTHMIQETPPCPI